MATSVSHPAIIYLGFYGLFERSERCKPFTEVEYQALNDIHDILESPNITQELLSAEKTPTLAIALPAFEILMDSWLQKQTAIPELAHCIDVGIAKIQEYVKKGRRSRVYALAMSKLLKLPTFDVKANVLASQFSIHPINSTGSRTIGLHQRQRMLVSVVSGVLVKCFLLEALCSTPMGLLIFENLPCNLSDVSVCEAYLSARVLFLAHPT